MTRSQTGPVLTASDYQRLARDVVDPDVWDFIEGGAESERTLRANVAAFDRVRLANTLTTNSAPAALAPRAVATSPSASTRRW